MGESVICLFGGDHREPAVHAIAMDFALLQVGARSLGRCRLWARLGEHEDLRAFWQDTVGCEENHKVWVLRVHRDEVD
jgi:hypothetical protein